MGNIKYDLLLEYQRLDLEYEAIRRMKEALRKDGDDYAVEDLEDALQHILRAILSVKKSWKFLPDPPGCEQIKMDI